jgi:Protein of unknown function (DUF3306)
MADGFLGRWSKRKAGKEAEKDVQLEKKVEASKEAAEKSSSDALTEMPSKEVPPPATLEDVAKIDRLDPDFSAFMKPDVDPAVQQAALKKMFTDPHFNIMDGLDIYIDDYSKPDPLPPGMLERMVQSDMLNLFRKKTEEPASQGGAQDDVKNDALAVQEKSDLTSTQNIGAITKPAPLDEVPNDVLDDAPIRQEHKKT